MQQPSVASGALPKISSARRRVKGSLLRAARDHVGLTQEQLAIRLDVRAATISDRETSGDDLAKGGGVSWETWLAWAMALALPADWQPPETPPAPPSPDDGA